MYLLQLAQSIYKDPNTQPKSKLLCNSHNMFNLCLYWNIIHLPKVQSFVLLTTYRFVYKDANHVTWQSTSFYCYSRKYRVCNVDMSRMSEQRPCTCYCNVPTSEENKQQHLVYHVLGILYWRIVFLNSCLKTGLFLNGCLEILSPFTRYLWAAVWQQQCFQL